LAHGAPHLGHQFAEPLVQTLVGNTAARELASREVAELIGRANWFEGEIGDLVDGCREFLTRDGSLLTSDRPELVGLLAISVSGLSG
jgi:hypothetical protein